MTKTIDLSPSFLTVASKLDVDIFTPEQLHVITNAILQNRAQQSVVSSEKFETVIAFLHGKFGVDEKPPATVKEKRSTIRKACDRAFAIIKKGQEPSIEDLSICLLYTSPSPRDRQKSRMPSSA